MSSGYELRAITDDEVSEFRTTITRGFGGSYRPEGDQRFRSLMPLDRTVAAIHDGRIVGTLGDFPLQLTVPGGAQVAIAGTTMVTVDPLHTRRGVLRSMLTRHLDSAVERGEPIAALWASEAAIYGRFGFGLASEAYRTAIDGRDLALPAAVGDPNDYSYRELAGNDIVEIVGGYWSSVATQRAGFIDRSEARWSDIAADPEWMRDGGAPARHVVALRHDTVVGYVHYKLNSKWTDFVADGTVEVSTLVASDADAAIALWRHVAAIDLFPHIDYWNAALDDPLPYVAVDSRAVKRRVIDALYVRILDVPASLAARRYEHDGSIVLQVNDELGYAGTRVDLAVTNGVPVVAETDAPADVTLDVRELGALFLGRSCAQLYAGTGAIAGEPAAVRLLGQLFATQRPPWCGEMF